MKPLMKFVLVLLILVAILLDGCEPGSPNPTPGQEPVDSILYKIVYDTITKNGKPYVIVDSIPYYKNEIILDGSVANQSTFRKYLKGKGFKQLKTCPCSGKLEIWKYQGNDKIDLIGVVQNPPPQTGGVGGLSLNYVIKYEDPEPFRMFQYNPDVKRDVQTRCPSDSVNIAVVDSGVDTTQKVLNQNSKWNWAVLNQLQNCPSLPETKFGLDIYGKKSFEPIDSNGHGSHVGGIIAGVPNQTGSQQGVKFRFVNVKVMGNRSRSGDLFQALCGLYYALDQNAQVINISWGVYDTMPPKLLETFVQKAEEQKVVIVAGMGNNGWNLDLMKVKFWPACFAKTTNVISVGAIDNAENRASFSNIANDVPSPSYMTVAAYGVDIVSTFPKYLQPTGSQTGYAQQSGTSMSTPFVTQSAAIILGIKPGTTPKDVKNIIYNAAKVKQVAKDTFIRIHQHLVVNNKICP